MNSIGRNLILTTFGESHGPAMGGILDGFPAGFKVDFEMVQRVVDSRRPGQPGTTLRKESDRVEFLSGFSADGISLGSPIGFVVRNENARSSDYEAMKDTYRPNHADYTYECRYGIRDHRGGGRASARETLSRVVGGALALQYLQSKGVEVDAKLIAVGASDIGESIDCLMERVEAARRSGDSIGGLVECSITGLPAGIGNPIYDKFSARLAQAMLSINAVMGFEYGCGFEAARMSGHAMADEFAVDDAGRVSVLTNNCGGIQGGITNGAEVKFRVAFKPTPTISQPLHTINRNGENVVLTSRGRHDPCVAVRGVVVVKAMAALVVADFLLPTECDYFTAR